MRRNNIFQDLFGLSGRLSVSGFFAALTLDFGIFCALIAAGAAFWKHAPTGPLHIFGAVLMTSSFLEVIWALISLLVCGANSFSYFVWRKDRGLQPGPQTEQSYDAENAATYQSHTDQNSIAWGGAADRISVPAQAPQSSDRNLPLAEGNVRVFMAVGRVRWEMLILCLIFTLIGMLVISHPQHPNDAISGYATVLLGGGGGVLYAYKTILGKPELRLDDGGFSLVHFGKAKRYSWSDIGTPFVVTTVNFNKFVQYSLNQTTNTQRSSNSLNPGHKRALSDIYGVNVVELAKLLNDYREKAIAKIPASATGQNHPNFAENSIEQAINIPQPFDASPVGRGKPKPLSMLLGTLAFVFFGALYFTYLVVNFRTEIFAHWEIVRAPLLDVAAGYIVVPAFSGLFMIFLAYFKRRMGREPFASVLGVAATIIVGTAFALVFVILPDRSIDNKVNAFAEENGYVLCTSQSGQESIHAFVWQDVVEKNGCPKLEAQQ
jgi:hypothetical protein